MNPAELFAMAQARGIDIMNAAQMSPPARVSKTVRMKDRGNVNILVNPKPANEEEVTALPAKGRESRSPGRKPAWTIAEIAQAAQGLPSVLFDAALYHWAGDHSRYWSLWRQLVTRAYFLQAERDWPLEVRDVHQIEVPYVRHLAILILDEDQCGPWFRLVNQNADGWLYAICMNCQPKTWKQQLAGPYEDLKLVWLGWLKEAGAYVQPRLRGDGEN